MQMKAERQALTKILQYIWIACWYRSTHRIKWWNSLWIGQFLQWHRKGTSCFWKTYRNRSK